MLIDRRDLVPLDHAGKYPALVLNSDYRPLSLFPLEVLSWQDAVKAIWLDRVDIIEQHDHVVRSPSCEIQLPSVVAVRCHVRRRRMPAFTRANVLVRDQFCCCYCATKFAAADLTYDHVQPESRGGPTSWENIVMACEPCNKRKANRFPHEAGMVQQWRAWRPSAEQLYKLGRRYAPGSIPAAWHRYLGEEERAA